MQFSVVAASLCVHISSGPAFQFLRVLVDTWYFLILYISAKVLAGL